MTDTPTAALLADRIRRSGPISMADYMSAVSDAYYARGDIFGAAGDFITAPEISQTFGELIGLWCAVVWQNMGAPAAFRLVECGPGRGTLMRDFLRATARVPGFNAAAEIHFVERSRALREVQRESLKDHTVTWHDDIDAVNDGPMILVANEFLDALPILQLEKTTDGWRERYVGLDDKGGFKIVLKEGEPLRGLSAPLGTIFEISLAIQNFIAKISRRIATSGGAALLIDYGHGIAPLGGDIPFGETLQAVRNHKPCGIFDTPGEADLTAHVNFDSLARTAWTDGVKVFGPVAQGTWLGQLGIKLRGLQLAKGKPPEVAKTIESGIRRLTEPDAMGALFKVIALAHPALATPDGFQQDTPA